MTVSVTVSVSEGSDRDSGSGSGREPAARPRHGHLRVVHTDRFEESLEPQRHGEHREGTEPAHPPTSQPRRHEDTKGFTKPPARPKNAEAQRRRAARPPTQNHEDTKSRRNHEGHPPAQKHKVAKPTRPKTQRRKGAKTQRGWCSVWAPFRLVAAERQAIGSPAAGEKRASSERERSSSPRFAPVAVPGARRFCLSPFPLSVVETIPPPSS